jgi:hypothetical protein
MRGNDHKLKQNKRGRSPLFFVVRKKIITDKGA